MRRYIAVCFCMLVGIAAYLVVSSIAMKASFDEWDTELSLGEDYEILHTVSLERRQQLAVVKLTDPLGERLVVLIGQNRLTHWKLIDSVDLGVYSKESPKNHVENPFLSAGYLTSGDSPPEDCIHIYLNESSYSLWYRLHEPGNHLGNWVQ